MHLLSKYNKGITYSMCAIDLFSKFAWVVPLKDKRGITIFNAFQKIISKGRELNKVIRRFLKINNIEMYSAYSKGKSVVAERFIRTLKHKIFKHMTASSKNVNVDMLDNIANKYNNTVYRIIETNQALTRNADINK